MFIINRAIVKSKTAVQATDNNNVDTGNQGTTWVGVDLDANANPANIAAGAGLVSTELVTAVTKETVISKLISIQVTSPLLGNGQDNYIRSPLSDHGLSEKNMILGAQILGIYDSAATNTFSFTDVSRDMASIKVVRDAIIIKIANLNQNLFQNRSISVIVYY